MQQTEAKESRYGAPGIPDAAPLVPAAGSRGGVARRVGRGLLGWLKSFAITFGLLYVLGWMGMVTFVTFGARQSPRIPTISNTVAKRHAAEAMRPFTLSRDASVTPEEAGVALFSLGTEPSGAPGGFAYRALASRPEVPWRHLDLSPIAFRSGVSHAYNGPDTKTILKAAHDGLSRDERATLRIYGTAPVWQAWDRVARAPAVDFTAGRLVLPFGSEARAEWMPLPRFAETKEFAYASVARAAWHLAQGRADSAEAALRAVVSVGFALVDNGTTQIDELIGTVVVGIGRDALQQLYTLTGDSRAATLTKIAVDVGVAGKSRGPPLPAGNLSAMRGALIAAATGPDATLAERAAALQGLTRTTCSNPRELITGPGPEVRAAFAAVRRDYARLPGQQAALGLVESRISQGLSRYDVGQLGLMGQTLDVISRVYFNPRLGTCAVFAGPFNRF